MKALQQFNVHNIKRNERIFRYFMLPFCCLLLIGLPIGCIALIVFSFKIKIILGLMSIPILLFLTLNAIVTVYCMIPLYEKDLSAIKKFCNQMNQMKILNDGTCVLYKDLFKIQATVDERLDTFIFDLTNVVNSNDSSLTDKELDAWSQFLEPYQFKSKKQALKWLDTQMNMIDSLRTKAATEAQIKENEEKTQYNQAVNQMLQKQHDAMKQSRQNTPYIRELKSSQKQLIEEGDMLYDESTTLRKD